MPPVATLPDRAYVLGHSEDELQRLIEQGRFFGDLTASVLQAAGVGEGMRVLDVGCASVTSPS